MKPDNHRIPQWSAPESLLPQVMAAARASRPVAHPAGFFAWPLAARFAFAGLALTAVVGVVVSPLGAFDLDPLPMLLESQRLVYVWLGIAEGLRNAMFTAAVHALRNPFVAVIAAGMCVLTMATWVADIHIISRLLVLNQRRVPV